MNNPGIKSLIIHKYLSQSKQEVEDVVAVEQALQITISQEGLQENFVMTMRTPGFDIELAIGLLYNEGVIQYGSDILNFTESPDKVSLELSPAISIEQIESRSFGMNSSCGICSKESVDDLFSKEVINSQSREVKSDFIMSLHLGEHLQDMLFSQTGGIHAAALFDLDGNLLIEREDIGRHNALDKLIGHHVMNGEIPLHDRILWLSGRASFELIQKASRAGIAIICSLGAPSSAAVELAFNRGMTLIGFLKKSGFNIYCGEERVSQSD